MVMKVGEVDALRPEVLNDLLNRAIRSRINVDLYNKAVADEKNDIALLKKVKKEYL